MSTKLLQNPDGADFQAQAVLAYVRYLIGDGIGWNGEKNRYEFEPYFARFDNCREQGYVIYMRNKDCSKQINITFYEHRNIDSIYVQVNNEKTFNAPQLDDITKTWGEDKYDSAFIAKYGECMKAARFIVDQLETFANEEKE